MTKEEQGVPSLPPTTPFLTLKIRRSREESPTFLFLFLIKIVEHPNKRVTHPSPFYSLPFSFIPLLTIPFHHS